MYKLNVDTARLYHAYWKWTEFALKGVGFLYHKLLKIKNKKQANKYQPSTDLHDIPLYSTATPWIKHAPAPFAA